MEIMNVVNWEKKDFGNKKLLKNQNGQLRSRSRNEKLLSRMELHGLLFLEQILDFVINPKGQIFLM